MFRVAAPGRLRRAVSPMEAEWGRLDLSGSPREGLAKVTGPAWGANPGPSRDVLGRPRGSKVEGQEARREPRTRGPSSASSAAPAHPPLLLGAPRWAARGRDSPAGSEPGSWDSGESAPGRGPTSWVGRRMTHPDSAGRPAFAAAGCWLKSQGTVDGGRCLEAFGSASSQVVHSSLSPWEDSDANVG